MDCKKSLKCPVLYVVQGTAGSFRERGKMVQKREEKTEFGEVPTQQGAKQHLTGASAMMMGTFTSQA